MKRKGSILTRALFKRKGSKDTSLRRNCLQHDVIEGEMKEGHNTGTEFQGPQWKKKTTSKFNNNSKII